MMPRLGEKYHIEIETISQLREEYGTEAYAKRGLPLVPSIMMGEEIVVEKADMSEEKLEAVICSQPGLPPPEPQKKGILGRLLNS